MTSDVSKQLAATPQPPLAHSAMVLSVTVRVFPPQLEGGQVSVSLTTGGEVTSGVRDFVGLEVGLLVGFFVEDSFGVLVGFFVVLVKDVNNSTWLGMEPESSLFSTENVNEIRQHEHLMAVIIFITCSCLQRPLHIGSLT